MRPVTRSPQLPPPLTAALLSPFLVWNTWVPAGCPSPAPCSGLGLELELDTAGRPGPGFEWGSRWLAGGLRGSLLPPSLSIPKCEVHRTGLEDTSPGTSQQGCVGRGSGLASAQGNKEAWVAAPPSSPLSESRASSSRSRGMESFQRETGSWSGHCLTDPPCPLGCCPLAVPLCTSLSGGGLRSPAGPGPSGKAPTRAQGGAAGSVLP